MPTTKQRITITATGDIEEILATEGALNPELSPPPNWSLFSSGAASCGVRPCLNVETWFGPWREASDSRTATSTNCVANGPTERARCECHDRPSRRPRQPSRSCDRSHRRRHLTAELRVETGLKMPDCLVLATARRLGARLLTLDARLARAAEAK
ncbi:MAG: PIN domain-containing protein [Ilumatobacter sp.]|uniref:PIN domain-containing protein n=1 Tax=Ilumatobacter sp. TaxID=1967498 RepID=UPI003C7807F5